MTGDLWRELKEAEAAAEAAHDPAGHIDVAGPVWRRFMAAKAALAAARPTDAAGLAAQVKFYVDLHAQGHDPNEDQEAMLAHVGEQLEAMAGRAAA